MNNKLKIYIKLSLHLIIILIFISCKKDQPQIQTGNVNINSRENVIITNEGNFQFGNASISLYDKNTDSIFNNVYSSINSESLGDVCQSMHIDAQNIYIVINNSQKINIIDRETYVKTGEIIGFNSPRYILPVSQSKAYVSDLYSNTLNVVNLIDLSIENEIDLNGWTEQLHLIYGKVYATNKESQYLYIIDTSTDEVSDSILIGYGSNSIKEDVNGKLWVLCNGDQLNNYASLYRINPINNTIEQSFIFKEISDNPLKLKINGWLDTLYFINRHIYKASINISSIPDQEFITATDEIFYGIGIDPDNGDIYISDAIDYVQKGLIYRYQSNGKLIAEDYAGVIPGDFYFK